MNNTFGSFEATPTLTLGPLMSEAPVSQMPAAGQDTHVQNFGYETLTEEEKKAVDSLSKQIDLRDTKVILQYGAGAQKKMADFSGKALESVKTQDLGEVGDLLSNVVTELKSFDVEEDRGLFGFIKKGANKVTAMKAKYDSAETNVSKISEAMAAHQTQLLKDSAMLDKMYDLNRAYFKEISMYILAGKQKLDEVRRGELLSLQQKAQKSGLPEDAQEVRDLDAMCNRFEKKLHDLSLTRMISIQTAQQIRLIQNNDVVMAEKIQSTLVNTIPLWKSQMALALGIEHSMQAAEAQRKVSDLTNELLKKNAAMLKTASIETAKESERGIVDMETLRATNETLISTLDEVMRIQQEGRQKRLEAEQEMGRMENELKERLLQISN